MRMFAKENVWTFEIFDPLFLEIAHQIALPRRLVIPIHDAIQPPLVAVDSGGVAVGVLIAVVAIVPVENVQAAVGADFLHDGHEPRVVGEEEIAAGTDALGNARLSAHELGIRRGVYPWTFGLLDKWVFSVEYCRCEDAVPPHPRPLSPRSTGGR